MLTFALLTISSLDLAACSPELRTSFVSRATSPTLSGHIRGGQQPVAGALIQLYPTHNVNTLFNLVSPFQPFQPVLAQAPVDWRIALLPALASPIIAPGTGLYISPQTVTISEALPTAAIYFTTDGSIPTTASTLYPGPFRVQSNTTVEAIAVANGYVSGVASEALNISAPTQLAFLVSPASGSVGSALTPAVQVAVEDGTGAVVSDGIYTVTLTLAANSTSSPLSGVLTATTVNGIATFQDVIVGSPGVGYTLQASAGGLSSSISHAFTISALDRAAVSALWLHPGNADSMFNTPLTAGEVLTPPPAGFAGLQTNLSSWFSPASSPGIWQASTSNPQVPVLFNLASWNNIASGAWSRKNNSPAVEAQILASSSPAYPLPSAFGLYSKYYYATTSMSGSGWIPPTPPTLNTQTAPPVNGLKVYAPLNAVPASDSDGYFAIFQPDGTVFECYSGIVLSSGTIVCGTYNVTHSWSNLAGAEGGIMASTVPVYAGLIRQADIDAGTIAHGLSICISPTQLQTSYTAPAVSFDRDPGYSGTLSMGTRLAIPLMVNLSAHHFQSKVGAMIAQAAQTYGTFLLDRGGPNGFTIRAEKNMTDPAFTNAWDWNTQQDLSWILSQLQVVSPN